METELVKTKKKRRLKIKALRKGVIVQKYPVSYQEYKDFKVEDGYKYEWKNGYALKNGEKMKNTEMYIVDNIEFQFSKTELAQKRWSLKSEIRCQLSENLIRIPDMALYSREQVVGSAKGENHIPCFVIEVISKNESLIEAQTKINEYLEAGVAVIWQIFPLLNQIWVFSGGNKITICKQNDYCQAAPEFGMTVNAVFAI